MADPFRPVPYPCKYSKTCGEHLLTDDMIVTAFKAIPWEFPIDVRFDHCKVIPDKSSIIIRPDPKKDRTYPVAIVMERRSIESRMPDDAMRFIYWTVEKALEREGYIMTKDIGGKDAT